MNKLVSKNSVQRFKQGRKIVKAKGGTDTDEFGLNTPYISRGNRLKNWISRKFESSGKTRYTPGGQPIVDTNSKKGLKTNRTKYFPEQFNKDYTHNFLTLLRLGYRKINGVWMSPEEQEQNRKVTNKKGTGSTKVTTTPRFLSRYSDRMSEIGGVNNIKVWQEKLKDYYDAGTYNPDSVWGANTEKAYKKYLAEQNNNLGLVKLEPVSIFPVKESVQQNDFAQDKQTGYPSTETIQSSSSVLNQQNDFASDRQNYYPSATISTPSTETVPVQQNDFASQKSSGYQSGQSRGAQLFSNITLRPEFKKYGYWRILNTNPFTIYSKQGSKLVYKNPVKRFKSNFR